MFVKSYIVFWTLILFQIVFGKIVFGFSGLYGDNGIDQTIRKKNIPRADIQRIRNHILDMVGLSMPPYDDHFPHKVYHNRSTIR